MFKLKYLLFTKGIQGVNDFLDKNPRYLEQLSEKQFNHFIRLYFDRPFDSINSDALHIFDFNFDFIWNYDNFGEEILLHSKYFQTITGGSILIALNSLSDCEFYADKLAKYLIYKLDAKQLLNYSIADLTHLIFYFSNMGLEEKLLECKNIDLVSAVSNEIAFDFEVLDFNKKIIPKLSLTDFREYCLKGNIRTSDIFKYLEPHLRKNREAALDTLFEIFMNRKEIINYGLIAKEESIAHIYFKQLAELEMFEEQDKEYLAFKILTSKNYDKMLEWLYYIDCSVNYQMISELVDNKCTIELLKFTHGIFLEYSIKMILEKNESCDVSIIDMILFKGNHFGFDRLNTILNIVFSLKSDFSITKQNAILLMKMGVDVFPILIERYLLNAEERQEILVSLKEANRFDLCAIYGSYLLSGNNAQLLEEHVIKREDALIRSLKPNKM